MKIWLRLECAAMFIRVCIEKRLVAEGIYIGEETTREEGILSQG
jgi:hypothetical protein